MESSLSEMKDELPSSPWDKIQSMEKGMDQEQVSGLSMVDRISFYPFKGKERGKILSRKAFQRLPHWKAPARSGRICPII